MEKSGKLYNDSKDKAEILINQFSSVFTKEKPSDTLPIKETLCEHKMNPITSLSLVREW